jgi:hypothetical protein
MSIVKFVQATRWLRRRPGTAHLGDGPSIPGIARLGLSGGPVDEGADRCRFGPLAGGPRRSVQRRHGALKPWPPGRPGVLSKRSALIAPGPGGCGPTQHQSPLAVRPRVAYSDGSVTEGRMCRLVEAKGGFCRGCSSMQLSTGPRPRLIIVRAAVRSSTGGAAQMGGTYDAT